MMRVQFNCSDFVALRDRRIVAIDRLLASPMSRRLRESYFAAET